MLFQKTELPRSAPVKRMHVADAGDGIRFECPHCGHDTGWIADEWTVTENRRGLPCPECNKQSN
jgi:predicted RNA-binding Zn-ribbon protein involved in translation (DUF1610 family)